MLRQPIGIELADAFGAGLYLLFGVINFDLWLKRRDRRGHLWLAGASGGALLVDLTGMALRGRSVASGILPLLNLLGVVIVTISLLQLVLAVGNRTSGVLVRAAFAASVILAVASGLGGISWLVPVLLSLCGVLMLQAMVLAFRAGLAGDRELRAITGGLLVLLLTLIVDVLRELHVIEAPPGIPILGFTSMFLVSATSLNARYAREHRELVALRHDLEWRVSSRTRELEEANQRLAEASRTDALTRLPNRRGFLELVGQELERSARAGEPCTLVMLDFDHFKQINDRYGHGAGDEVLQAAATLLRTVLRPEDLIARWGGEEFIVLLPNTTADGAVTTAGKARRALASYSLERNGSVEAITASFGIAAHQHGRSLDETIAAADEALYRAKEAGRDCVMLEE